MKQQLQNKPQPNQVKPAIRQTEIQSSFYSGPLPPPDQLQAFEQICPGAADRIIAMAERENSHRHRKESNALNGTLFNERFGMVCAFFICIATIAGGVYCISKGSALAGAFISAVPLSLIVAAFIRGRKHNIQV